MSGPAYAPRPDPPPSGLRRFLQICGAGMIFVALAGLGTGSGVSGALMFLVIGSGLLLASTPRLRARLIERLGLDTAEPVPSPHTPPSAPAPSASVEELHARTARAGGGIYLARDDQGRWITAPPQAAVLVLAGPRAGKTSCVVIPALACHPGPAVATSTKSEILTATLPARQRLGTCWYFDLDGQGHPAGTQPLRWSPVTAAGNWSRAQNIAEQMAGAADGHSGDSHWSERAGTLIAALLHAAAVGGLGMREVLAWTLRQDSDSPLAELTPGSIAHDVLTGIARTADRERSGIYSTAARILRAYTSETALATATDPNFDAAAFVQSTDTIYIAAPAQDQRLLAPLVVGLLSDLRQGAYHHHHAQPRPGRAPLLLMLDECANIAPIPDLPAMLSEAGGQGIHTVCVFQDMSQARRRWPRDTDGMLTLYGARVILAGIADPPTLRQLSLLCGDWDRPVQTTSRQDPILRNRQSPTETTSWSTRREARLPPDEIAQLPRGRALITIGPDWEILPVTPWDQDRPSGRWPALTIAQADRRQACEGDSLAPGGPVTGQTLSVPHGCSAALLAVEQRVWVVAVDVAGLLLARRNVHAVTDRLGVPVGELGGWALARGLNMDRLGAIRQLRATPPLNRLAVRDLRVLGPKLDRQAVYDVAGAERSVGRPIALNLTDVASDIVGL